MSDMLNIGATPSFDERITKMEVHSYGPYANTTYGNNDEIRIPIQQQDLYTLPCESYLYIEGRLNTNIKNPSDTEKAALDNNCVAFMLDEIRYELNGVEIDRCRNVGITTSIKNYLSLSDDESKVLRYAGWERANEEDWNAEYFNFCVPLRMLLGFCEDYKRIVINARHELVLIRARVDANAVYVVGNANPTIEVSKIQWRMPHVSLEDTNKLNMLRILDRGKSIPLSFRSWDLYEYPMLQTTTKHTWAIKTSTQLEKPRYVVLALQTNRKNQASTSASQFQHCKISNVRLFLNSESYPYDDLNLDFDKNRYAVLYNMYARFRKTYYDITGHDSPMLDMKAFSETAPLIVLDCSRQNESVKNATVDVRIEFECRENVPANTTAYCLIIHDRIVEYNPLTNVVHKLM